MNNPSKKISGNLDIPQNADLDTITRALEKLIKIVQDNGKTMIDFGKRLDDLEKNIKNIETNNQSFKNELNHVKNISQYAEYQVSAEDQLKEWMMQEKDEDATDFPMTKEDIAKGMRKFVERSGVNIIDDEE